MYQYHVTYMYTPVGSPSSIYNTNYSNSFYDAQNPITDQSDVILLRNTIRADLKNNFSIEIQALTIMNWILLEQPKRRWKWL
jgi:hypothetical protein